MSQTVPVGQSGGTGLTAAAIGSILYTNAANQFTALTGASGDDGKVVRFNWNAGSPTFTLNAVGTSDIPANFTISGPLTPAQITADQNDYNPTSLSTATVLRLSTDASRNITGLAGPTNGRVIQIHNVGSFDIVLKNQSASSAAANRFAFSGSVDVTVKVNSSISLWYDNTTVRWRAWGEHAGILAVARGGTASGTALANSRVMVSSGSAIVESAAATNGQLLIGSTGAAPVWATLTQGANITITNAAGVITIAATGGATSPFSAAAGIIDYVTATDRLRLKIGEDADIGLEIVGRSTLSAQYLYIRKLLADANPVITIDSGAKFNFGAGGGNLTDTQLYRSGTNTLTMNHLIVSGVAVVGGATTFTISPASHTAVTAEVNEILKNASTLTVTGTYTYQRFAWIRQPTVTSTGAQTITRAATLAIEGAPIAAGSAVLTDSHAIWVQGGSTLLQGRLNMKGPSVAGGERLLWLEPGNHSSVIAESHDLFRETNTLTITGAYSTQRFALIRQSSITASSSLTVTTAATLAIDGPPLASGSAVITNAYSVWVQAGRIRADGGVLIGGEPAGIAGTVGYSNTVDNTANSTGVGSIKFKGATARDSSGFLKILDGTTARYVPYFDAITG